LRSVEVRCSGGVGRGRSGEDCGVFVWGCGMCGAGWWGGVRCGGVAYPHHRVGKFVWVGVVGGREALSDCGGFGARGS